LIEESFHPLARLILDRKFFICGGNDAKFLLEVLFSNGTNTQIGNNNVFAYSPMSVTSLSKEELNK